MEIDPMLLKKVQEIDEAQLKDSITRVADEMGVNEMKTKFYLSDMKRVKEAISSIQKEDLEKIARSLGDETWQKLVQNIGNEVKRTTQKEDGNG